MTSRRSFLVGAAALIVTAPSIVRAESLMPVKLFDAGETIGEYALSKRWRFALFGDRIFRYNNTKWEEIGTWR